MKEKNKLVSKSKEKQLEGRDYYIENGLMVLTEKFLTERGYCCENNCRHCPYNEMDSDKSQ